MFCENLIDIHIKREMKRLVRSQTTISFSALRSEAIRLEEDRMGNSYQNVRRIQEPHHTPGDSSPLDRIAAQLELLATTQSEIVSLLRSQQQAPVGGDRSHTAAARCIVTTFAKCWKRASDRRRNGEQSTNREYRGHSNDSTETNAMQGNQVGHPRSEPALLTSRDYLGN